VQEALQKATSEDFDIAFLDINLHGQKAHVLPGVLERRHKPFAFVTGYGEQGVLEAHADAPVVASFQSGRCFDGVEKLKSCSPCGPSG
jgi:CheY-like chemotaxis protein